jgi:hypothetical protein
MPTLLSHTQLVPVLLDCQAAQANAQTKAMQQHMSAPLHDQNDMRKQRMAKQIVTN